MDAKDLEKFDSLIRQKLDHYQPATPPGVWEGIASGSKAAGASGTAFGLKTILIAGGVTLAAGTGIWAYVASGTSEKSPASTENTIGAAAASDNTGNENTGTTGNTPSATTETTDVATHTAPSVSNKVQSPETPAKNKPGTKNTTPAFPWGTHNGYSGSGDGPGLGDNTRPAANKDRNTVTDGNFLASFDIPEQSCPNSTVIFVNLTHPKKYVRCEWYLWEAGKKKLISNLWNPGYVFGKEGNYKVQLLAYTDKGEVNEYTRDIRIEPVKASFSTAVEKDKHLKLENTSAANGRFIWDFGDGNRQETDNKLPVGHDYKEYGKYTVRLVSISEAGCTDTVEQAVRIEQSAGEISIRESNVFTPNGDNLNDRFLIPIDGEKTYFLRIVDGRGETVFETKDKNNGWDGTHYLSGEWLPAGTYKYALKYTLSNGKEVSKFGEVMLMR